MLYSDFAVTIAARQGTGYPVSAVAQGLGRVSHTLPPPDAALTALLSALSAQALPDGVRPGSVDSVAAAAAAGNALFSWLMAGSLETHLRLAWDRATQAGRGLRLRLSIDPPELSALPWELLHDPDRDHWFGTAIATPLVRYLDQTEFFGALARPEAELPLHMLLVLPSAPELDLAKERALIEEALRPLAGAVRLHVLDGPVTLTALSDVLMTTPCDIIHVTGHGAFVDGAGYVGLNTPDGGPDWVDARAITRLLASRSCLKLVVLNSCSTGRVDEGAAFRGLAPQLVRAGIPAVVAMQFPLADAAALTFAREFYRQLCAGEQAGQVDVAAAHARNMLAILHQSDVSFAAPVLYTHASDGVIYAQPGQEVVERSQSGGGGARLAMLLESLRTSLQFEEDWLLADRALLEQWRSALQYAERAYTGHLQNRDPAVQQAAHQGLDLIHARLAALDAVVNRATPGTRSSIPGSPSRGSGSRP